MSRFLPWRIRAALLDEGVRGPIALLSVLVSVTNSSAQTCNPEWLPADGFPGLNGWPYALKLWDPDGPGPEPAVLVAGGAFSIAGNVPAMNIAAWNGSEWSPLGPGLGGIGGFGVKALIVFNSELIAGGSFGGSGGPSCIARWDGVSWTQVGQGFAGGTLASSSINAFAEYDGSLIAAGRDGGFNAAFLRRWDGVAWQPMEAGLNRLVHCLAVHAGELYAGGEFTASAAGSVSGTARWDGTNWQPLGSGVTGSGPYVRAITTFSGDLIVGGDFSHAGGQPALAIARWDGSAWHPFPSAIGAATPPRIFTLSHFDGRLAVGGSFDTAGGQAAANVTIWNGAGWETLGPGLPGSGTLVYAHALAEFGGELVVGGSFKPSAQNPGHHVAKWDGQGWSALGQGLNESVQAMAVFGGDLVAAGPFSSAGALGTANIARRSGSEWAALGTGVSGGSGTPVRSLALLNGDLIAAGDFTIAGSAPANRIARWDGALWYPLGSGITGGSQPAVYTLAPFQSELAVGGNFTSAGGQAANRVARWNGVAWLPLGSGNGMHSHVLAIAEHNADLVAGGAFTMAGGTPANRVARLTSGTWQAMGAGLGTAVGSLLSHNGELYAGTTIVSRWTGSGWEPLAGLEPFVNSVKCLAWNGNHLYVGGARSEGSVVLPKIVRWDAGAWAPLGLGVSGEEGWVYALTPHEGGLLVGGDFQWAGGNVSPYLGRWGCSPCYPDCNASGGLTVADFTCFQTAFVTGCP